MDRIEVFSGADLCFSEPALNEKDSWCGLAARYPGNPGKWFRLQSPYIHPMPSHVQTYSHIIGLRQEGLVQGPGSRPSKESKAGAITLE